MIPGTPEAAGPTLAERAVARLAAALGGRELSRRGFLARAALVASALTVDPLGFLLRPQSAYATVCGESNECDQGWTAFCCTIADGANLCPPGSYAAGWWKVDASDFCRGAPHYIIDCNRLPSATCRCDCADGACDRRKVCCNRFRYGQCNQHVGATTEVVCRVRICTPPWEWDDTCTTTVRTDNTTRTHSASCLPGPGASEIQIKYQDLGLVGSVLGAVTVEERPAEGGGALARYEDGLIAWTEATGAHAVHGPIAHLYDDLGGVGSELGYPVADVAPVDGTGGGTVGRFEGGAIWGRPAGEVVATAGAIHDRYELEGAATGWLGFPIPASATVDGRRRVAFERGWSIFQDPGSGEVRVLPSAVELPDEGWPPTPTVSRWDGDTRYDTAGAVSRHRFPEGAPVAFLVSGEDFADALACGVPAALAGGPVLLTPRAGLAPATRDELRRLAPATVVIMGGSQALASGVTADVRRIHEHGVHRYVGASRYATAVKLSAATFDPEAVHTVWIATGEAFADGLSAVPAAAATGSPVLLVRPDGVPGPVRDEISRLRPTRIVLAGGRAAVGGAVEAELAGLARTVVRVEGDDRYGTAAAVTRQAFPDPRSVDEVVVATGEAFPDALAAGPGAALAGAPVLLVTADGIPPATERELLRLGPRVVRIAGGTGAVDEDVRRRLGYFPTTPADGER